MEEGGCEDLLSETGLEKMRVGVLGCTGCVGRKDSQTVKHFNHLPESRS